MKLVLQKQGLFNEDEIKYIESLGYELAYYKDEPIEGEVFVGLPKPTLEELDNISGLKYIQSVIVGYDSLDMDKIKDKGITFANASGIGSAPIAEYVVLKILDYYKKAEYYRQLESQGVWGKRAESDSIIEELYKKKVLVLGTGSIGVNIAKRLNAFDCEMIGVNSSGKLVDNFSKTYPLSEVYDVLNDVDVVVGALPLNDATRNLYDEKFFNHMKKDSIFINVGRGPSLVVSDLEKALENNLAHAYLDVLPIEPLAKNSPLYRNPKLSITPHNSSSSKIVINRVKDLVIKNLENYRNNDPLINKVI